MNDKNIKISVLLPVYNSSKYLRESLDSIINQTFTNFELICVYDKSDDDSLEILNEYAQNDSRVSVFVNEQKRGLGYALNKGLELAKGEYIARMDADDIALPDRFKVQTNYLDTHKSVGICGSFMKKFGKVNRIVKYPTSADAVRANMCFNCCISHPTVMMKKAFLEKYDLNYDSNYKICEDYEFWSRCLKYFDIVNIPKVLLNYRAYDESLSESNTVRVANLALDLTKKQLEFYFETSLELENLKLLFADDLSKSNYATMKAEYKRLLALASGQQKMNYKYFKKYLNKTILKTLKKKFKETRSLFFILKMFEFQKTVGFWFLVTNMYRVKRI